MKNKFALAFILVFVAVATVFSIFLTSHASANEWYEYSLPDINTMTVYVDGEIVWYGYCYYDPTPIDDRWRCITTQIATPGLERGGTTEVKVTFMANTNLEESKVKAWIGGYHDDIEAETSLFDVFANNTYTRTLNLEIPKDIDAKDTYTLHVDIQQKHDLSGIDEADIDTTVQKIANVIDILGVELYDSAHYYGTCTGCAKTFDAGTTLYVDVAVKNRGNYEAEDVYVRVTINELYIERTVYLGDLEASDEDDDEDAKSITVALQIPKNARGVYTLQVRAYNDEVSDTEFRDLIIERLGEEEKEEPREGRVEMTPLITTNEIEVGKGAVYTIRVTNFGNSREDFVVSTVGTQGGCEGACTGWGETIINPQSFSLNPGESRIVNVYLAVAENAIVGEHTFSARIENGEEAKQFSFVANVTKPKGRLAPDLKTILMIVGIVLAVAVIVLLVILLTSKKSAEKTEVEESYY
ncbi:MAG: hypothetical protein K6T16_00895 [Candidatus Pacearchaeota archaeon]|nr:hypothetical protein [Candidatus Pacearchaeota archaeon]